MRLRRVLENIFGEISDELFKEAADESTNDIKANRLSIGKKTQIGYAAYVMITYILIVKRIEKSPKQCA